MNEQSELNLDQDDLLTTNQAAKLLKVHLATVYRWILTGRLPGWRRGGRFVVRRQDLNRFLERVVPLREQPRLAPTRRERKRMSAETERGLKEAGIL